MKTKKTRILLITLIILIALLPFALISTVIFILPSQFDNTFLGGLAIKYDRLKTISEPKIVIIGGSSAAFGLRSDIIEQELGYPTVNFGLYATIGTKAMLDISRDYICEGDIVIIAPETDAQTYSLFFDAGSVLQACDGRTDILFDVAAANSGALCGSCWSFSAKKAGYVLSDKPNPTGVYNCSSFNELGDIIYPRPYNVMENGYLSSNIITLDKSIVSDDFIDYVNEYADYCTKRGASVFFSFSPMNESALAENTTKSSIFDFYTYLDDSLDFPLISNPMSYIYDEGYFYDTNFHLNDSGVYHRTAALVRDIKLQLGITTKTNIELPPIPVKPEVVEPDKDSESASLFTYTENSKGALIITGVTDEALSYKTLTLPTVADGKRVIMVAARALSRCNALETLIVPGEISEIADFAFEGCASLEKLVILAALPDDTAVGGGLLEGAPKCEIELRNADIADFSNHYFWSQYYSRFIK